MIIDGKENGKYTDKEFKKKFKVSGSRREVKIEKRGFWKGSSFIWKTVDSNGEKPSL